ncbi:oxidoreductase [Streptomyces sp. NPDC051218]|uniref:oxidoreductase n=1 Tax=Streptomyces sp. NPDC051218 TaxID=3365645 RepID=UPI0037AEAD6F
MDVATAGDSGPPAWLTEAEAGMWEAFRTGSVYDMRTGDKDRDDPHGEHPWGPERSVRARVVAWLLLHGPPARGGRVTSLKLRGVQITDVLDIAGGTVAPYVEMKQCRFEKEVLIQKARLTAVRIVDCSVPCLAGGRVSTEGDLDLSRCRFQRGVRLTDARIGGDLLFNEAVVYRDRRGNSIAADGLSVGRDLQAESLESHGELCLRGAMVGVSLSLRGSKLVNPYGLWALNAPQMTVQRTLHMSPAALGDRLQTGRTPDRASRVQPFECQGGIRLDDGLFGEAVDLAHARFTLEHDQEVSLRRVQTPELRFLGEAPQRGRVILSGAKVVTLIDKSTSWPGPGGLQMDGFSYEYLVPQGSFPLSRRLSWVAAATAEYNPEPYEKLAATLRNGGEHADARQVYRAQQRRWRTTLPWPERVWHALRAVPGISVILWTIIVIALLTVAWRSTRAVLPDISHGAELGPSDAPPVVVAVVSLITASGVLIGGILNGLAKFVRARGQNASDIVQVRGQADADLIRAQADMRRAEADMLRARAGLPPGEPSSPEWGGNPADGGPVAPPALSGNDDGAPSPS